MSERHIDEMPEDTASAVTVTDAALLRMATADPHWRCAYCESDQRALDGGCKNCGASPPPSPATQDAPPAPTAKKKSRLGCILLTPIVVFFVCCCPMWRMGTGPETSGPIDRGLKRVPEWTRRLQVKEVAWEHTVTVERRHQVDHEGFTEDRPSDALQVKSLGQRHHHDERVRAGYETVYYTERKQSGYTTETDRDKEPKYVDERRSRKEPRYRSVPREAAWFSWKEWEWREDRSVKANGKTLETRWPSAEELRPPKPLPRGGQERNSRSTSYTVVLQGEEQAPVTYSPKTLEEFQRFAIGSTHTLQQEQGVVSVVAEKPPPPAPAK
ncbi:hypothetical protein ACN469_35230 [Corallococcus terminator]